MKSASPKRIHERGVPSLINKGKAFYIKNEKTNTTFAKVLPGEFYISNRNENITTVLGSCIAACIRDPVAGIGGLNHFLLPCNKAHKDSEFVRDNPNRYGIYAMDNLINSIVQNGGSQKRLEVKIFGGGKVIDITHDVGSENIDFINNYLHENKLAITAKDIGGDYPRKIIYTPKNGKVKMSKLHSAYRGYVAEEEMKLLKETVKD